MLHICHVIKEIRAKALHPKKSMLLCIISNYVKQHTSVHVFSKSMTCKYMHPYVSIRCVNVCSAYVCVCIVLFTPLFVPDAKKIKK